MNNFIREINTFYNNSIYYGDTDILNLEKKYWDVLDKANLVSKNLRQAKNDYTTSGVFYGLFLAPEITCCFTIHEFGIFQQHMTFKGFNDSKRLLDWSKYFDMLLGKKISAMLPKSWKKSFDSGIIIPAKMKRCNECKDGILCKTCNNQFNENKIFKANLHLLKTSC